MCCKNVVINDYDLLKGDDYASKNYHVKCDLLYI